MKDGEIVIGLDLGGTKIEAVAARRAPDRSELDVIVRRRVATMADRGYEAVLGATAHLLDEMARSEELDLRRVPIGMGMPGGITRRTGLVKNSNAVCLNGRPFRDDLQRELGRSIAFDNDANCFALAEAMLGAARAHRDGIVFGVILGTGVGGGVVVRGDVWPGAQGIAGEWGHHVIHGGGRPCYCGHRGCVECYVSGPAVEKDYEARAGVRRPLIEIVARRGQDAHADAAVEEMLEAFGRGLANVIDVLDPSAVVLGGGVSNQAFLYDEGVARVAHHVFNDELSTPILKHALGDSAGVLGAALIAK
ncbi:ROK family Glucokinase with ambiguous substrate specificity [Minicystis rosea]|nr:ROK family Glucokinase with ambiguous substrate specificity [Minicystis rosea]